MSRLYAVVSAEIEAEPEELWDIAAQFEKHPQLSGSGEVQKVRPLTPGPVREGYRVSSSQRVSGISYRTESTVTKAERGKVLVWMSGLNEVITANEWGFEFVKLEPTEDHPVRTRVTHTYRFNPPLVNIWGPLIAPFFKPRVRDNAKGMKRTLENMARVVSGEPAHNFDIKLRG